MDLVLVALKVLFRISVCSVVITYSYLRRQWFAVGSAIGVFCHIVGALKTPMHLIEAKRALAHERIRIHSFSLEEIFDTSVHFSRIMCITTRSQWGSEGGENFGRFTPHSAGSGWGTLVSSPIAHWRNTI